MPILGTLFTTLFSGLVAWFAQFVARKAAFGIATVTAMSALTLALFVLMRTTLVVINGQMTGAPAMFMDCLQMVIPPIAPACISTYVTLWTACTVYTWQKDLLHIFAKS